MERLHVSFKNTKVYFNGKVEGEFEKATNTVAVFASIVNNFQLTEKEFRALGIAALKIDAVVLNIKGARDNIKCSEMKKLKSIWRKMKMAREVVSSQKLHIDLCYGEGMNSEARKLAKDFLSDMTWENWKKIRPYF